ncbi:hypothetical protein BDV96DRAFT_591789 [Lophiotrema nucula]|uniref:Gamma-glutamylcyclotransferase AIG2-like domain-containing protein n=1 Tax=Lophiotrema nucula TaxID=690887 RepID=A0A6A5YF54_9PLEO|nr:hypothetical protein BDV96DRAFT_591789 [Lophiotrema nucula]
MAARVTRSRATSQVERLEDWEAVENPTFSKGTAEREERGDMAVIGQLPPGAKAYTEIDAGYKAASKSKHMARTKKGVPLRQMQQLDLGPSEIAITSSASTPTATTQDAAAATARGLGYSGDVSSLPRSLQIAINNRFTRQDLTTFKEDAELNFTHALPYFFSGSFIFPSCLRAVTDGTTLLSVANSMTPATLYGFNRFAVKGQPWPAMLPSTNSNDLVKGMLVFGMLDSQRRAIHRFENSMFDLRRTNAEIELMDGHKMIVDTGVYVWNREPGRLVSRDVKCWRLEDLMESSWFNFNIRSAEEEEKLLEEFDISGQ